MQKMFKENVIPLPKNKASGDNRFAITDIVLGCTLSKITVNDVETLYRVLFIYTGPAQKSSALRCVANSDTVLLENVNTGERIFRGANTIRSQANWFLL